MVIAPADEERLVRVPRLVSLERDLALTGQMGGDESGESALVDERWEGFAHSYNEKKPMGCQAFFVRNRILPRYRPSSTCTSSSRILRIKKLGLASKS